MNTAIPHPAERANTHELIRGRVTLGEFEITVLTDGYFLLDGGAMFGVVPRPLWLKRVTPDAENRMLMGSNTVVIRDGKRTVIIETGLGNKLDAKMRAIYGAQQMLPSSFAAAGICMEEVDVVINSHLHFDHCGWNTTTETRMARSSLRFPTHATMRSAAKWSMGGCNWSATGQFISRPTTSR